MNINTHCNGCVFSINDNGKQTGCRLDRSEKLGISSIDSDGSFILDRFCTTYRPESWLEELSVSESTDIKTTVLNEISPRVGFFVILNTEDSEAIKNLEITLQDIKNQTRPPRYIVVITDKVEYNEEIHSIFRNYFDFKITEYHIVQLLHKPDLLESVIDVSFIHAKNGWAYVCESGQHIDTNLIDKIHQRINVDLKMLCVIRPYDGNLNGLLFQTALFKFLNGNGTKVFQDTNVDSRTFIEKVEHAAANSNKETLITWEEFNES